jgi:hypothetical protein
MEHMLYRYQCNGTILQNAYPINETKKDFYPIVSTWTLISMPWGSFVLAWYD